MFMLREVFEDVNGFNENLFWMEDIDLCIRLRKKNFKVLYTPKTQIIHYGGKSSEKNISISISSQILSKIKFLEFIILL